MDHYTNGPWSSAASRSRLTAYGSERPCSLLPAPLAPAWSDATFRVAAHRHSPPGFATQPTGEILADECRRHADVIADVRNKKRSDVVQKSGTSFLFEQVPVKLYPFTGSVWTRSSSSEHCITY